MTHLSDEQLDAILQGDGDDQHVARCPQCAARLAERQAVADRLRSAFDSIRASDDLTARVRGAAGGPALKLVAHRPPPRRSPLRWAMPAAAAAVVVLSVLAASLLLPPPAPALAAQEELYNIHQHTQSAEAKLHASANPDELAKFLKAELGFDVALPELGAGMSLRGCCVVHFKNQPVGSYVVDTPRGVISVIVVAESLESLGMATGADREGRVYGMGSFAKCSMVAVTLEGYTYCAVGDVDVPHEMLMELLAKLIP